MAFSMPVFAAPCLAWVAKVRASFAGVARPMTRNAQPSPNCAELPRENARKLSGNPHTHPQPPLPAMSVVPLTLTISLCLVFTFVLFFLREHSRHRFSSPESEALLPLADESPRVVTAGADIQTSSRSAHEHAPGHVCKGNGSCSSCQRRAARAQAATGHHA